MDKDIIDFILPPLKTDFGAFETYELLPLKVKHIQVPISCYFAECDMYADAPSQINWSMYTSDRFEMHSLPNAQHHFYNDSECIAMIASKLLDFCD